MWSINHTKNNLSISVNCSHTLVIILHLWFSTHLSFLERITAYFQLSCSQYSEMKWWNPTQILILIIHKNILSLQLENPAPSRRATVLCLFLQIIRVAFAVFCVKIPHLIFLHIYFFTKYLLDSEILKTDTNQFI